jgi:hypothetical protein
VLDDAIPRHVAAIGHLLTHLVSLLDSQRLLSKPGEELLYLLLYIFNCPFDPVWAAASPQSNHKRQQNKRTPGVRADEATGNGLISYGYRNTEPILVLNSC